MEAYVEWTDEKGEAHSLHLIDRIYIGRKCQGVPDDKKVVVNNPHVSKDHAVLTNTGGRIVAYDMSRNGTYVNGARITPGVEHPLQDGDIDAVGNCSMRVVVKELAPAFGRMAAAEETMTISSQVVVTNLVADVRGYTAYSQKLDSAVMYEAMKEIFDDFSDIVHQRRGMVMDYAGDAIFAVWEHGKNEDPEKAALACQAAVDQHRTLAAILDRIVSSHEGFRQLQMGWGITTGEVTLSHYGVKKDYREWSARDCSKLLQNSPWSKMRTFTAILIQELSQPSAVPGREHAPQISYVAMLWSALPVRQAVVRQAQRSTPSPQLPLAF